MPAGFRNALRGAGKHPELRRVAMLIAPQIGGQRLCCYPRGWPADAYSSELSKIKESPMRRSTLALCILIASLPALGFAGPPKGPVTKWRCEDFLAIEDTYKPQAVYWASAFAKGYKAEAAVIDIEGTEQITPLLIEECLLEPQSSFWQRLKTQWYQRAAAPKAGIKGTEQTQPGIRGGRIAPAPALPGPRP